MQVIIYDAVTRQVRRQFTRFKDKAYCGTYRSDNKLLVAGGEDGIVQVQMNCIYHVLLAHMQRRGSLALATTLHGLILDL